MKMKMTFDQWITMAGALALAFLLVGAWLALAWWAGRYLGGDRKPKKEGPMTLPAECKHRWRSIASPYAQQCTRCGDVVFREDQDGNFPDGFQEYFDYIKQRDKPRLTRAVSGYHVFNPPACCGLPQFDPIHDETIVQKIKEGTL